MLILLQLKIKMHRNKSHCTIFQSRNTANSHTPWTRRKGHRASPTTAISMSQFPVHLKRNRFCFIPSHGKQKTRKFCGIAVYTGDDPLPSPPPPPYALACGMYHKPSVYYSDRSHDVQSKQGIRDQRPQRGASIYTCISSPQLPQKFEISQISIFFYALVQSSSPYLKKKGHFSARRLLMCL